MKNYNDLAPNWKLHILTT